MAQIRHADGFESAGSGFGAEGRHVSAADGVDGQLDERLLFDGGRSEIVQYVLLFVFRKHEFRVGVEKREWIQVKRCAVDSTHQITHTRAKGQSGTEVRFLNVIYILRYYQMISFVNASLCFTRP